MQYALYTGIKLNN